MILSACLPSLATFDTTDASTLLRQQPGKAVSLDSAANCFVIREIRLQQWQRKWGTWTSQINRNHG